MAALRPKATCELTSSSVAQFCLGLMAPSPMFAANLFADTPATPGGSDSGLCIWPSWEKTG